MAKLRTYTQEDLARSYTPLSSTGVGAKGSQSNPYTESEMNEMIDNGTWTGGFVVGLGYVAAEHTVTGKPSSGSASDWRCPNCDVPYPPDGSMKCSNCGTELSYGSGSSSSSGGGGGGGTSEEDPFENEGDITPEMLTNAAEETIKWIVPYKEKYNTVCNYGVNHMFQLLFDYSSELDGKKANQMVEHWKSSSNWREIPMNHAQPLTNNGNFVVAGWINTTGGSGHVVAVVPGTEVHSPGWGGLVPVVMDTGLNMCSASQSLARSFTVAMKPNVLFFVYEPE